MEIFALLLGGCFTLFVAAAMVLLWRRGNISNRGLAAALTCLILLALIPTYFLGHYMLLDEPLVLASERGDLTQMKALVAMGANVNTPSEFNTPLIGAVSHGHYAAAEYLLMRGANPNLANNSGESPLHFAHPDKRMVALLKQFGGH